MSPREGVLNDYRGADDRLPFAVDYLAGDRSGLNQIRLDYCGGGLVCR